MRTRNLNYLILVIFTFVISLNDISGIVHVFVCRAQNKDTGFDLENRLLASQQIENLQTQDSDYCSSIQDGLALIKKHPELDKSSIGCFAFSNPFNFLLKHPPAIGMPTCWQDGRMQSENAYPNAARVFRGTDVLMVPQREKKLPKIYANFLIENFQEIDETRVWKLYLRKDPLLTPRSPLQSGVAK